MSIYKKESNRINETCKTTLENIDKLIDVNSIIGEPIILDKTKIIPITTISIFNLLGGGEYGKINLLNKNNNLPYSIGNGSIINVKPLAFIVKKENENIEILNVASTDYEKIIDKVSNLIKDNLWKK